MCTCHSADLYASLTECPHCGHRSYDRHAEACERRKCGFVGEVDSSRLWTVEARSGTDAREAWTEWSAWVDRATAEMEKEHAEEDGYEARIVRAT